MNRLWRVPLVAQFLVLAAVITIGCASTGAFAAADPTVAVEAKLGAPQPPPGTSGRVGGGFAATPDGTHAVLYGGGNIFDGGGQTFADTWVWDGAHWSAICGVCAPGRRGLVAAATSPTGVVLYGGQVPGGSGNKVAVADSWSFDGSKWHQLCTTCPPGARAGAAMAGNGTDVLLFGGGLVGNTNTAFGDTWRLSGNTWTLVEAGGPGSPAPRIGAGLAWDGTHYVLFGGLTPDAGSGNNFPLSDTWIWSGSKWVQECGAPLAACGPSGRVLGGMARLANPDPARRGALLVGGLGFPDGTNGNPAFDGDIWFWNGARWIKQPSPWADSTAATEGGPAPGLPFVGVLAALPATCRVTLAADFAGGSVAAPTITAGAWSIGFDADHDTHPDGCAASAPGEGSTTTTTAAPTTTTTIAPGAGVQPVIDPGVTSPTTVAPPRLPATGSNRDGAAYAGLGACALGAALLGLSRRTRRRV